MKKFVTKLLVSLTVLQALCCTDLCGSFDPEKTRMLWAAIQKYKAPEFESTEVNALEETTDLPVNIFGVPQGQDVSDAWFFTITTFLQSGGNPNETKSQNGRSMLQSAILQEDPRLVERLLLYGANPVYVSNDGVTPLAMALNIEDKDCRAKIISALRDRGILIDRAISLEEQSLQYALLNKNLAVIERIFSYEAKVNLQNLLNRAAREGNVGIIGTLNDCIKKMPRNRRKTYRSFTEALCIAAKHGRVESTRALLVFFDSDSGVNAHYQGKTPLCVAIENCKNEVVGVLLDDPRTDVNACTANSVRPIHLAVVYDPTAVCLRKLLSHPKIEVNAQGYDGETALHKAMNSGAIDVIQALLEHRKIDVNQLNIIINGAISSEEQYLRYARYYDRHIDRYNALYQALRSKNVKAIEILLKHPKISVNKIIKEDRTIVGLLAQDCDDDRNEGLELLCADHRTIIDPHDCVCSEYPACKKHKLLKQALKRKQNCCHCGCACC